MTAAKPGPTRCRRCGALLGRTTRFCGACGTATSAHRAMVQQQLVAPGRSDRRHALALAIAFAGTLAGLIAVGFALGDDAGEAPAIAGALGAQVAAGCLALAALGRGAWREALAGPPTGRSLLAAVPVGLLGFALALGWVELLHALADARDGLAGPDSSAVVIAAAVVGAPLVEEWLDRGVVWRALAPLTTTAGQVVVSATLFGLAHGLNGGFLLELPHRFAGGLLLGALRARSGSLVPSIVAHAAWNACAVAWHA